MKVAEIMTENPLTIQSSAPVSQAVEALYELPFRHLPVLDGNALVGMLSDRDLKSVSTPALVDRQALTEIQARYQSPISELMSPSPLSVDNEAEISEVVEQMLEHRVGALPVVDASTGDLLGIVSYVDVLRAVQNEFRS